MRIWDLHRNEEGQISRKDLLRHHRAHVQPVTVVAFNDKNDGVFASAGADGAIKLYDPQSESFTLSGHSGPVRALLIAPDQSFVVSAGNDGTIRFWRAASQEPRTK
jgi:WD40 repeat protein